ncbi:MAG: PIN domain-containing protein [Candidatus Aenigmarchaeota archaeon]|nr:PIN domain-containing protein [Candidatus Aenigmarchaeota archaeon]
MSDSCFIDSNILIYTVDSSERKKHNISKQLVKAIFNGEKKAVVSNQILAEFFFIATHKIERPISPEEAETVVNAIIFSESWIKVNYGLGTIRRAMGLVKEHKASFWDALIGATMHEAGVFKIYTENVKDFQMPGIEAESPFVRV